MKSKIYQFICIELPKNKEGKEKMLQLGGQSINFVLAKDEAEARMKAARMLDNRWDIEQIEIVMRPF